MLSNISSIAYGTIEYKWEIHDTELWNNMFYFISMLSDQIHVWMFYFIWMLSKCFNFKYLNVLLLENLWHIHESSFNEKYNSCQLLLSILVNACEPPYLHKYGLRAHKFYWKNHEDFTAYQPNVYGLSNCLYPHNHSLHIHVKNNSIYNDSIWVISPMSANCLLVEGHCSEIRNQHIMQCSNFNVVASLVFFRMVFNSSFSKNH